MATFRIRLRRVRPARLGYRPELEGVRGIAILLVLGAHLATLLPDVRSIRVYSGFLGVDLFFVMSGFLITTLLLEEHATKGEVSFSRFYGRRALRLYPLLIVGIGVAAIAAAMLGRNGPGMPIHEAAVWVLGCVANWADRSLGLLAHTWALGVEEQFYLLWPAALFAVVERKAPMRRVAVGLVVAAAAIGIARVLVLYGGGSTKLVWGVLRSDAIMLGSAVAVALAGDRERVTRLLTRRSVVLTAAAVLAAYVLYVEIGGRVGRAALTKDLLFIASGAIAVLIGALVQRPEAARRRLRALAPLGRISYALFLVHYPVFAVLRRSGPRDPVARIALALVIAFALSVALYHLVERPALGLKDRLFGREKKKELLDRERVGGRGDAGLQVQGR